MSKPTNLGWMPSPPDRRDYKFANTAPSVDLPQFVDLRDGFPAISNQKNLGACTAFSVAAVASYLMRKQDTTLAYDPSELYIYYFTRKLERTISWDSGATLRNAMKSLHKFGVAVEKYWKYQPANFRKKPPKKAINHGKNHQITRYMRLNQTEHEFKQCLANGWPFVFGFSVFDSLYNLGPDAVLRLPQNGERWWGGHAVVCCGYDDERKLFLCRNSWGRAFGDEGYFWMPYELMLDSEFAMDFWMASAMELPKPKPTKRQQRRKAVRRGRHSFIR